MFVTLLILPSISTFPSTSRSLVTFKFSPMFTSALFNVVLLFVNVIFWRAFCLISSWPPWALIFSPAELGENSIFPSIPISPLTIKLSAEEAVSALLEDISLIISTDAE